MGFFNRSAKNDQPPVPAGSPISEFWRWWTEVGHTIDPRQQTPLHDDLTQRVKAIHPDLSWHFGPGGKSEHRLTVTSGGTADVRPAAAHWHRAAPPADPTWEFAPAMDADPNAMTMKLQIGGHELDLTELRFAVDEDTDRDLLNVTVYHPAFADMAEDARPTVVFLSLDWALGEDNVVRWLGGIDDTTVADDSMVDHVALRAAVERKEAERDPDQWSTLSGEDSNGNPVFVMVCTGVRWIDAPHLDQHHAVRLPFSASDSGLPDSDEALDGVIKLEDSLVDILGAAAIHMASETYQGVRTVHVYADSEDQNASDQIQQWCRANGVSVDINHDPAWHAIREFTG